MLHWQCQRHHLSYFTSFMEATARSSAKAGFIAAIQISQNILFSRSGKWLQESGLTMGYQFKHCNKTWMICQKPVKVPLLKYKPHDGPFNRFVSVKRFPEGQMICIWCFQALQFSIEFSKFTMPYKNWAFVKRMIMIQEATLVTSTLQKQRFNLRLFSQSFRAACAKVSHIAWYFWQGHLHFEL